MIELLFCMHVVLLLSAWFTSGHVIEPVLICIQVVLSYSLPGLPVGKCLSLCY